MSNKKCDLCTESSRVIAINIKPVGFIEGKQISKEDCNNNIKNNSNIKIICRECFTKLMQD